MRAVGKYTVIALIVTVLLGCLAEISISQDQVEDLKNRARQYYWGRGVTRDYSKALSLYLKAAEAGDAEAQYIAGGMYFKGMGTAPNMLEAFRFLYEAAKNGKSTTQSQKILAKSFLIGQTVPKNIPEAVRWYSMAAKAGDSEAQNELAYLYFTGQGVEQDFQKAHQLFSMAAKRGSAIAQYNMGIMYYTGNGVPEVDLKTSYAWFNLAAANGYEAAIAARSFLETVLSPTEISQAQKQSKLLYDARRSAPSNRRN